MELYYTPFTVSDKNMNPEKFTNKDKEDLKEILTNINRRRTEIKRFTDMFNSGWASDQEKIAYEDQVKKNTKVIWHLKKRANTLMEQKRSTKMTSVATSMKIEC